MLASCCAWRRRPRHGEPLLLLGAQELGPGAAREPAVGLPRQQVLEAHLLQALTSPSCQSSIFEKTYGDLRYTSTSVYIHIHIHILVYGYSTIHMHVFCMLYVPM